MQNDSNGHQVHLQTIGTSRNASSLAGQETDSPLPLGEKGLYVPLSTGTHYFNYYWLRDACPSTMDPVTHERIFDISTLSAEPYPEKAYIDNDNLIVHWLHESHRTSLDLFMLEEFCANHGRMPDPANLTRRLWRSQGYEQFVRLAQKDIENSTDTRARFARAIIEDGVALVTDMENSDEALTRLAQTLGPITPTVDGYYFDVRLTIHPTNLAYTANALELHTDLPNEEAAPGVQFLHCRANSVEGGQSIFVDGAAVAEALRSERPDDFELLAAHDIPFFRRHNGWDYRSHQRVIELDATNKVSGLTISQHLQDCMDLPQTLLDEYYPAFCRFISMLKEERFVTRFRLAASQCIVFDNHRVVHGREAFVADDGERHLRGCYVDRGALRSTYRTLSNG